MKTQPKQNSTQARTQAKTGAAAQAGTRENPQKAAQAAVETGMQADAGAAAQAGTPADPQKAVQAEVQAGAPVAAHGAPAGGSVFRRDFTLVVIGQIISLFGNAIIRFALPLYLLRQTGSTALFGMVSACSFLPMVVLSLMGGVLADRVNKRNIMVVLDFCTAALILAFYFALGTLPTVPLFIVTLMLLYGIFGTYQPAVQASIPALVPQDGLLTANAVIQQVNTLAGLLGPIAGGILFGMWGITPILLLGAVCFAFSAIMELFIHIPHVKRQEERGALAVVRGDLRESFHFVRRERPVFFSVLITMAVFNLVLSAGIIIGVPVLIVQTLGLSDALLGFAQGAQALGGLTGGVLSALFAKRLRLRAAHLPLAVCAAAVGGMGLALLLPLSVMAAYAVIAAMGFLIMCAATVFTVQMFSEVQRQTPPLLVGKVMAVIMAISGCAQPVGQAMYGVLFGVFSTRVWLVLFFSAFVSGIVVLRAKSICAQLEGEGAPAPQNAPVQGAGAPKEMPAP